MNKKLNPWFSIWIQPRATIRQIFKTEKSVKMSLLLFCAATFFQTFERIFTNQREDLPLFLLKSFLISIVLGPLVFVFSSFLLRWTGRWIGGKAKLKELELFLGWSKIPALWMTLLWIPLFLFMLLEKDIFLSEPSQDYGIETILSLIMIGFLQLFFSIWSLVISLKCLGEAQKFSAWKALLNIILVFLVIFIPLAFLFFLYTLIV